MHTAVLDAFWVWRNHKTMNLFAAKAINDRRTRHTV